MYTAFNQRRRSNILNFIFIYVIFTQAKALGCLLTMKAILADQGDSMSTSLSTPIQDSAQQEDRFTVEVGDNRDHEVSSLTFEEKVRKAETLLKHNPSFRHIFRHILEHCENEAVLLAELEDFVENQPHFATLKTPQYFPIHWLVEAFALEELYVTEDGNLLTAEDVAQLSEDEFDDLIVTYAYRTTQAGIEAAHRFSPSRKLAQLLNDEPDRSSTYLELLHFLEEKKSFASIEALLRNRAVLQDTSRDGVKLQPSLFVDKLEATGAITYDSGWRITPEGKEMLATLD